MNEQTLFEIFHRLCPVKLSFINLQNGQHNFVSTDLLRNRALLSTQKASELLVLRLESDILTRLGWIYMIRGNVQRHCDVLVALNIQQIVMQRQNQVHQSPAIRN